MSDSTSEVPTDAVTPKARTITYFILLGVSVVSFVFSGVATIFDLLPSDQVVQLDVLVVSTIGMIGGGMGVAYRPTRPTS